MTSLLPHSNARHFKLLQIPMGQKGTIIYTVVFIHAYQFELWSFGYCWHHETYVNNYPVTNEWILIKLKYRQKVQFSINPLSGFCSVFLKHFKNKLQFQKSYYNSIKYFQHKLNYALTKQKYDTSQFTLLHCFKFSTKINPSGPLEWLN